MNNKRRYSWYNEDFTVGKLKKRYENFKRNGFVKLCEFDVSLIRLVLRKLRNKDITFGVYENKKKQLIMLHSNGYVIASIAKKEPSVREGTIFFEMRGNRRAR